MGKPVFAIAIEVPSNAHQPPTQQENRKSTRNSDGNQTQGVCMFCSKQFNKKSSTHVFTRWMRYVFENEMATELNDVTILTKLMVEGVHGELQYHIECLVWFRNKHRDDQRPRSPTKEMESQAFPGRYLDLKSPIKP